MDGQKEKQSKKRAASSSSGSSKEAPATKKGIGQLDLLLDMDLQNEMAIMHAMGMKPGGPPEIFNAVRAMIRGEGKGGNNDKKGKAGGSSGDSVGKQKSQQQQHGSASSDNNKQLAIVRGGGFDAAAGMIGLRRPSTDPEEMLRGVPPEMHDALMKKYMDLIEAKVPAKLDDLPELDAGTGLTHASVMLSGWKAGMCFRKLTAKIVLFEPAKEVVGRDGRPCWITTMLLSTGLPMQLHLRAWSNTGGERLIGLKEGMIVELGHMAVCGQDTPPRGDYDFSLLFNKTSTVNILAPGVHIEEVKEEEEDEVSDDEEEKKKKDKGADDDDDDDDTDNDNIQELVAIVGGVRQPLPSKGNSSHGRVQKLVGDKEQEQQQQKQQQESSSSVPRKENSSRNRVKKLMEAKEQQQQGSSSSQLAPTDADDDGHANIAAVAERPPRRTAAILAQELNTAYAHHFNMLAEEQFAPRFGRQPTQQQQQQEHVDFLDFGGPLPEPQVARLLVAPRLAPEEPVHCICLDYVSNNLVEMFCHHSLCYECFRQIVKTRQYCPFCNRHMITGVYRA